MNARKFSPSFSLLRSFALCLALICAAGQTGQAQQKEDPLKVQRAGNLPGQPKQNQPPGGSTVQQQSRPFYVQGIVTALLTIGAIWTVCRSSRRV